MRLSRRIKNLWYGNPVEGTVTLADRFMRWFGNTFVGNPKNFGIDNPHYYDFWPSRPLIPRSELNAAQAQIRLREEFIRISHRKAMTRLLPIQVFFVIAVLYGCSMVHNHVSPKKAAHVASQSGYSAYVSRTKSEASNKPSVSPACAQARTDYEAGRTSQADYIDKCSL